MIVDATKQKETEEQLPKRDYKETLLTLVRKKEENLTNVRVALRRFGVTLRTV